MRYFALVLLLVMGVGCAQKPDKESAKILWTNIIGSMDGMVVNPGVEASAAVKYTATLRAVGVAGKMKVTGEGDQVFPEPGEDEGDVTEEASEDTVSE